MLKVKSFICLLLGLAVMSLPSVSKAVDCDQSGTKMVSSVFGATGLITGIPAWVQASGVFVWDLPISLVVTGAAVPAISLGVTVYYHITAEDGLFVTKKDQRNGALLDRARSEAMEVIAMREIENDQQDAFPVTLRKFIGITRQTLKEDAKASVYEPRISDQDLVDGIASGQIQVQI